LFEDVTRGSLGTVVERLDAGSEARGEHVIVIAPAPRNDHVDDDTLMLAVRAAIADGASARDAATTVARDLGVPKRRAYEVALRVRTTARR
jgi:16S rRNA C1402 (ribose-2'-O) methylase RsmI